MSKDFAMIKTCGHIVYQERLKLEEDLRTCHLSRIPTNGIVDLKLNGQSIPMSGLWSPAQVVTKWAEPFRIEKGKSDVIYLNYKGEFKRIELPAGSHVKTDTLVAYLKKQLLQFRDLMVYNVNGHLAFRNTVPYDGDLFTFVDPRTYDRYLVNSSSQVILNTYKALGISPGIVVRSIREVPSFTLTYDNDTSTSIPSIQFKSVIEQKHPILTITYTTNSAFCYRCNGSRVEHDYVFDVGGFETVQGINLLAQEIERYLFTDAGSHFKWPWYGSNVADYIGGKSVSTGATSSLISTSLTSAFEAYRNIKSQQAGFQRQDVTDEEFPFRLASIDVTSPPDDPSVANVSVVIQNRSGNNIYLAKQFNQGLFANGAFTGLFSNSNTSY
jgi:hypothetical protein